MHRADFGQVQVTIWHALREATGREVALKVIEGLAPDSMQTAVFARCARLWGRVRHPFVIALEEDGTSRQPPYIAMEYAQRGGLEQALRSLRPGHLLVPDEGLRLFVQLAHALGELDRQGIVHRAVQPSNILVAADGSYKLSDFFLAKEIDPSEVQLTRTGRAKGGSPFFMSPEQLRGGYVDGRTDIYALACVFYLLLVGHPPHVQLIEAHLDQLAALALAIFNSPPPPLPDMSALPRGLDRVLERALQPNPEWRYRSAAELLNDLASLGLA